MQCNAMAVGEPMLAYTFSLSRQAWWCTEARLHPLSTHRRPGPQAVSQLSGKISLHSTIELDPDPMAADVWDEDTTLQRCTLWLEPPLRSHGAALLPFLTAAPAPFPAPDCPGR
jgi:hypothetical protein